MKKSKALLGRGAKSESGSEPSMTRIRKTSRDEVISLFAYSNSRLEAVNWCPMWGVVSSQKRYDTDARSMALECGGLMHDVFAAVRIWQLWQVMEMPRHAEVTARRIFGKRRWDRILKECPKPSDHREFLADLAFGVLHTSGWEDNVYDKNRTMQHMELASIQYIDERLNNIENWPLYVEDEDDPECMVGIEQTFDVVVEYTDGRRIRFIGTIDGLVIKASENVHYLDENKTAARLDSGWRAKWELNHQVTGYCASGSVVFGFPVRHSRVTGIKIGSGSEDPYTCEPVPRDDEFFQTWARWLYHSSLVFERYKDGYEAAPRYTHACNRFFRPCSLIPFCSDSIEGRGMQWDAMIDATLSPSEQAILDKLG